MDLKTVKPKIPQVVIVEDLTRIKSKSLRIDLNSILSEEN